MGEVAVLGTRKLPTRGNFLNREQEAELYEAYRRGDKRAKDLIIRNNERIAYAIAKRYSRGRYRAHEDDIRHEALCGLLVAFERFDPSRANRFSSYASHWIRHAIQVYLDRNQPAVSFPRRGDISPLMSRISQTPGITPEQLAERSKVSLEVARCAIDAHRPAVSTRLRESGEEWLPGDNLAPEDSVADAELVSQLMAAAKRLPYRLRRILELRFADEPKTLSEVGEEFGVCRERIRQLEMEAMVRLRIAFGLRAARRGRTCQAR